MRNSSILEWICWGLVVLGGLNWGLFGLFKLNLVNAILHGSIMERLIYIIVGLAAAYLIYALVQRKKTT